MQLQQGHVNTELLFIADSVAREKGIDRDSVIASMEQAILSASKRKYGNERDIHVHIDRKTGEIKLYRTRTVVDNVENTDTEISLSDATNYQADVKIGDTINETLPAIDLGRVSATAAKQVIVQRIREAERDKQYDDFKDRVGEIVNGSVERVEYGIVTVSLGHAEAVLLKNDQIRGETFRQNDRVRAYLKKVIRDNKGPQIFLSRTDNQFLAKLFTQEVPEIYDGVIEIKAVAREPGSRAKIAVYARDSGVDPVGSCVGVRGSRVQAIISELKGEKIDIIHWSGDVATFVVRALSPAEISKVIIDEENQRVEVVVPPEQQSIAIGRGGQNVRLASQLTGWTIDILTDDQESKRRVEEFENTSQLFMRALDVEEVLANLLVSEGFSAVEDIAYIEINDLMSIEGFDEGLATALKERAAAYIVEHKLDFKRKLTQLGVEEKVADLPNITPELIEFLAMHKIKTISSIADLSRDELLEILPENLRDKTQADEIILAARNMLNIID